MEWVRGQTIGHGSSATVSIAMSNQSNDIFAVKSVEFSKSDILKKEEKILSSLNYHPQIINYLGSDITSENNGKLMYNLFMEYISGGSLTDQIQKQGGKLDELSIRSYTCEILMGLDYLHSNRIVHCDIKGRNILIGKNGAKIADLGCAKLVEKEEPKGGFKNTMISGTPVFMAPEVARGEEQGYPSDIWALGCTIIEMGTGNNPWPDVQDPISALYRIGFSEEVPEFPDSFSEEANDFLSKCLIRDPKQRWTANQLLQHPFLVNFNSYSKQIEEPIITNSPTSILDQGFWDLMEVSETCSNSAIERLKRVSSSRKNPNWVDNNDWITIRNNNSNESLNFSDQIMTLCDEYPSTSYGLDDEDNNSGRFDFEKGEFSCCDYEFRCNCYTSKIRESELSDGFVLMICKCKIRNLNLETEREFNYVFFNSNFSLDSFIGCC